MAIHDTDDHDRIEAYKNLLEAKRSITKAAQRLGYENIHEVYLDEELESVAEEEALKAMTNAYSYLDNGAINAVHPDGEN